MPITGWGLEFEEHHIDQVEHVPKRDRYLEAQKSDILVSDLKADLIADRQA